MILTSHSSFARISYEQAHRPFTDKWGKRHDGVAYFFGPFCTKRFG